MCDIYTLRSIILIIIRRVYITHSNNSFNNSHRYLNVCSYLYQETRFTHAHIQITYIIYFIKLKKKT